MNFTDYTTAWAKAEVQQAKLMVGMGLLLLLAFGAIWRGENALLKGSLLPLGLLLALLVGYGGYIFYSRPAHAQASIRAYQASPAQARQQEAAKHAQDNRAGNSLLRIYPLLMLLSAGALALAARPFYKGMALGFVLFFVAAVVVDNGFVTRSDAFLSFLRRTPSVIPAKQ